MLIILVVCQHYLVLRVVTTQCQFILLRLLHLMNFMRIINNSRQVVFLGAMLLGLTTLRLSTLKCAELLLRLQIYLPRPSRGRALL